MQRVQKDILIEIFSYFKHAYQLYSLRFVCKKWANAIAFSRRLWEPFIKPLRDCPWNVMKETSKCNRATLYAQWTLRRIQKRNASAAWLANCMDREEWSFLFMIMAPIFGILRHGAPVGKLDTGYWTVYERDIEHVKDVTTAFKIVPSFAYGAKYLCLYRNWRGRGRLVLANRDMSKVDNNFIWISVDYFQRLMCEIPSHPEYKEDIVKTKFLKK